jgi:hypothetical protein
VKPPPTSARADLQVGPAEPAEPGLRNLRPRRAGLGTTDTLLAVALIFAGAGIVLVLFSVLWALLVVLGHLAGAA